MLPAPGTGCPWGGDTMGTGEGRGATAPGAVPAELGGNEGSTAGSGGPRGVSPGVRPSLRAAPCVPWPLLLRHDGTGHMQVGGTEEAPPPPQGEKGEWPSLGGGHIHGMEPIGPLCPL